MSAVFFSHQPLINRQSKIVATRLTLHPDRNASSSDVARALAASTEFWPQSEKLMLINFANCLVDDGLLDWEMPESTTLEIPPQALAGPGSEEFVSALQATPASLCLIYDAEAQAVLESSALKFRFIGFDAQNFTPPELRLLTVKTQAHGLGMAFRASDEAAFQSSLNAGINAVASWFFKRPSGALAKALNPGQAQIVRVINLVPGNAWLVGELIRNLLFNAIQHTPVGCKLGIHIESDASGSRLLVWNEGEGLPDGLTEQLFEPFATSFSTHGTGLGLAISKEITDTLGGQITLNNRLADGKVVGLDALLVFRPS